MAHPLQTLGLFLANRQRQMDVDHLQRGREDRARKERDAQRELEAARHKERLDRQEELDRRSAFGLQQDFYTKIQDPAQIEPHMKEFQRRGVPGAEAPGTLGPTRMPEVPMYEDVRVPYDIEAVREPMGPSEVPGPLVTPTEEQINLFRTLGVPLDRAGEPHAAGYGYKLAGSEPIEFGDVIESQVRRPPIPAQAGYRTEQRRNPLGGPAYDAPPTQPMARGYYDALMARQGKEDEALRRKSGVVVAGHMREQLMADPTGEGAGLIFQMDTEGAPPPSRDAVIDAARRGAAALTSGKDADRAARRRPREHRATLPKNKWDGLLSAGSLSVAVEEAENYVKSMRGKSEKVRIKFVEEQFSALVEKALSAADARKYKGHLSETRKQLQTAQRQWGKMPFYDARRPQKTQEVNNLKGQLQDQRKRLDEALLRGVPLSPATGRAPAAGNTLSAQQVRQLRALRPDELPGYVQKLKEQGFVIPAEFGG